MELMPHIELVILSIFLIAFLVELAGGRLKKSPRPLRDFVFMLFGMFSNLLLAGAVIGSLIGWLLAKQFPDSAGSLAGTAFWLAFPVIFFIEEFAHYWLHRAAHEWRWLWKIHRTHHSAEHLNISVVYRYNFFWVFMLPQTWMGAFAVYFGLGEAFLAAVFVTYLVNLGTHSSYRWDLWLRNKAPVLEPVWKVIERVVTLPDTHHAHHAYGKSAHPNGNYAVTVFLFDMLFGTAKIPNGRQTRYGLPISPRLHWAEELLWPVVRKPLLPKPEQAAKTDA
ncbi:sterol desaturase family protein [Spongiibacter marinus]|uniref:sterol desaturase family protein n=1 Tax=Spongiibacter marinus TaxID=354246 RepID=UPI0035667FE5